MASKQDKYESIHFTPNRVSKDEYLKQKIEKIQASGVDDPVAIIDIEEVINRYRKWSLLLPRVTPFYAMKANNDGVILNILADMGCNFDCASKAEIVQILDMGIDPSRIVYTITCKQLSHLKYARERHVDLMTFDNNDELIKISNLFPDARLLLRFKTKGSSGIKYDLGQKFGCDFNEAKALLSSAKTKGLCVVGVSFHVGSGCQDSILFNEAIGDARVIFNIGKDIGFNMTVLDIGGGYPGRDTDKVNIEQIACTINTKLDEHFPKTEKIDVIAEPGRYFVEMASNIGACVIGRRIIPKMLNDDNEYLNAPVENVMYYINDGTYGSLSWLLEKKDVLVMKPIISKDRYDQRYKSSVWGPTSDSLDCLTTNYVLPLLEIGDWVIISYVGAYSLCAATDFNGMPRPICYYFCSQDAWLLFKKNFADRS